MKKREPNNHRTLLKYDVINFKLITIPAMRGVHFIDYCVVYCICKYTYLDVIYITELHYLTPQLLINNLVF